MLRTGGSDDSLAAEMHEAFPEFSESLILSFLDAFTFYDARQTQSIGFASLGPALMILGLNPKQTALRAAIREVCYFIQHSRVFLTSLPSRLCEFFFDH